VFKLGKFKMLGRWIRISSNNDDALRFSITTGIIQSTTTEKTTTIGHSITTSVEAGFDFLGSGGKATIT